MNDLAVADCVVYDKVDPDLLSVSVRTMTHQLRFLDLSSGHDDAAVVRELLAVPLFHLTT